MLIGASLMSPKVVTYYGSHLVMVGWVVSLVVIADGATSTELSSLFCELCFVNLNCSICVFDMYVLCMSVFFFSCVYTCPMGVYMNDLDLVNWCEVITFCMML